MGHREVDGLTDVRRRSASRYIQHAQCHDAGRPAYARGALAVIARGADDAGDVRAVSVEVHGVEGGIDVVIAVVWKTSPAVPHVGGEVELGEDGVSQGCDARRAHLRHGRRFELHQHLAWDILRRGPTRGGERNEGSSGNLGVQCQDSTDERGYYQ